MKKTLLILTLLAVSKIAFCQSQSDFNYSFGIKAFTVQEYSKLLNEVRNGNRFYNSSFNGLVVKVNDNQISYRFQFSSIKEKDYSFKNECENCQVVTGNFKTFDLKIGFERSLVYSKLQPFYGIDFGYKRTNFDGVAKDAKINTFLYNANIEKNGGLISPFIGLKYNIIPSITISAESGLDFIYSHDKEIKSDNSNAPTSVNNFTRWQFISKPLGMLSLQYNFGRD